MKRRLAALFLSCILLDGFADAGGPLRVTGVGATNPGQPYVWDALKPIRYAVDGGPLSVNPSGQVVISNSQGLTRVQNLFQNWQSVSTTSITYSYAGQISGAGIPSNGDVKTIQDFNAAVKLCNSGTQNPVIFDADGSLLRALGLSPLVIGFSGTCKLDPQAGHIVSALVFLNGEFQDSVNDPTTSNYELTADQFDEAITHEMGHFSGLGHSQINLDLLQSGFVGNCPLDELAGLPLMFPVEFCQSRKSAGLPILAPDDVAWISKLYPNSTYASNYGIISGFVFFSDGITHVQGLNVIARRVDDPSTPQDESKRIAVSVVSGFEFTGNPGQVITGDNSAGSQYGSRNPALIGYYEIPVTPGTYTVQTENLDSSFVGGSSVGPLDPPAVTNGAYEYWHQYESAFDDPSKKDPLTVQAGQRLSNINFILNQTPPRFDQFEDGEVLLEQPEAPFVFRASLNCRIVEIWV
ncbi:MAG TPA: hypothetical protein VJO16_05875 [Candidatus Acidoferrum sp.]|nr:hypothetical protein [Candidatus Acidoferrum sp.]